MQIAEIFVQNNKLQITQLQKLTRGIVGATVSFSFGPEWNHLAKTAVFRTSNEVRDVVNIQPGEDVLIPWELTSVPLLDLMVGVYGSNGDGTTVIATAWGSLGQIFPGAYPSDRPSQPNTPDWTEQIQSQVNHALEEVRNVRPLTENAAASEKAAADHAAACKTSADSAKRYSEYSEYCARRAIDSRNSAESLAGTAEEILQSVQQERQKVDSAASDSAAFAGNAAGSAQAASDAAVSAKGSADSATRNAQLALQAADRSLHLGVTGAKIGNLFRVKAVNAQGQVTEWEPFTPEAGPADFELIEDITTTQDAVFKRNKTPDNKSYYFSAMVITIEHPVQEQITKCNFFLDTGRFGWINYLINNPISNRFIVMQTFIQDLMPRNLNGVSDSYYHIGPWKGTTVSNIKVVDEHCAILVFSSEQPVPAGTHIKIYGRWKH